MQTTLVTNTVALKGSVPKEGPLCVPMTVDFTTSTSIALDFSYLFNRAFLSQILAVFVDNSQNTAALTLYLQDSNQTLTWPANSAGYLPVLQGSNLKFIASSTGALVVEMQFINFPVAVGIWSTNGTPIVTAGKLSVSDAVLEATVSGGAIQVKNIGNVVLTGGSGTITTGGTSQTLFAANAARQYWRVQNTSTADLWINDNGGNAGVNVADSFKLAAGAMYESSPGFPSNKQINIFGATTGQQFSAVQA